MMCGCSHTLLNIFWGQGGQVHPCSGFYIVLGETQEGPAAMASTLQGRGERSEEAEKDDYLNLHLRSWERNS